MSVPSIEKLEVGDWIVRKVSRRSWQVVDLFDPLIMVELRNDETDHTERELYHLKEIDEKFDIMLSDQVCPHCGELEHHRAWCADATGN